MAHGGRQEGLSVPTKPSSCSKLLLLPGEAASHGHKCLAHNKNTRREEQKSIEEEKVEECHVKIHTIHIGGMGWHKVKKGVHGGREVRFKVWGRIEGGQEGSLGTLKAW